LNSRKAEKKVREAFSKIRNEMNDHLTAINENTNEIQTNYEQLYSIENKYDRLSERLDEMQLLLNSLVGNTVQKSESFSIRPLSKREKEVYQVLSTIQENKGRVTYEDISRRTGLTPTLVITYLTAMIHKGIPLIKRYINNIAFISIDEQFRNYQIKYNIIGVDQHISAKSETWQR